MLVLQLVTAGAARAQVPPSPADQAGYRGLFAAAHSGDLAAARQALAARPDLNQRDGHGRTALHVAAFAARADIMRALVEAGADANALERDRYDIVTIAAVANDTATLAAALALGCKASNITSRYDGTALIAAAHLGHHESIDLLIKAGAPIDHVNNLGWTAVIESITLGDGGPRHQKSLALLLAAGADPTIPDRQGTRPIALARTLGYAEMVRMLEAAEKSRSR